MVLAQIWCCLFLFAQLALGLIEEIPLPDDIQTCFDKTHAKGNLTELIGEKVLWHCIHGSLSKQPTQSSGAKIPEAASKWFADLIYKGLRDAEHRKRTKRQAQRRPLRIRREYRMIGDVERNLFHRAINMLKYDRVCSFNPLIQHSRLSKLSLDRVPLPQLHKPTHLKTFILEQLQLL